MLVTIADVLRRAEEFEHMLAAYYDGVAHRSVREGVRMLADYMSRHRERIGRALAELPGDRVNRLRRLTLRYEPQAASCRCFEGMELPAAASAGQVLDVAVKFDECLINLYRQAARQVTEPEARELFESLIRIEERDEIELKKMKAMDYF